MQIRTLRKHANLDMLTNYANLQTSKQYICTKIYVSKPTLEKNFETFWVSFYLLQIKTKQNAEESDFPKQIEKKIL